MASAVAVDLGASSIRSAIARLQGGRIQIELLEQIPHAPIERDRRLTWDGDLLLAFALQAADAASSLGATLGIDGWGVDHGFIDRIGRLAQPLVAYRDRSHDAVFQRFAGHRPMLYQLTGIQHQPFNTIYQLAARRVEDPQLDDWLLLPDLLGFFLTGERVYEATNASTTQLVGLDGNWCSEAFSVAGWDAPSTPPRPPGAILGRCRSGAPLALVASHDTASAVAGLGRLGPSDAFLNIGSWSLLGTLVEQPLVCGRGESAGFTNERAHDGRVRLLANVPGLYVLHRLHDEVARERSFEQWIDEAVDWHHSTNLMAPSFFNPERMSDAIAEGIERPKTASEWAGLAISSLVDTIRGQLDVLERLTGQPIGRVRVSGGAVASPHLMRRMAMAVGRKLERGPSESTLLGNAAVQFVAQREIPDWHEMADVVERSLVWHEVSP